MKHIFTPGALILKDSQVLLVKSGSKSGHLNDRYGLPAGHMDEGETEKQTVVREVQEETGLVVTEDDLQDFAGNVFSAEIVRKDGSTNLYTMKIFRIQTWSGELQGNEETTPEWITIDELDRHNLLPNVKQAVINGTRNL